MKASLNPCPVSRRAGIWSSPQSPWDGVCRIGLEMQQWDHSEKDKSIPSMSLFAKRGVVSG